MAVQQKGLTQAWGSSGCPASRFHGPPVGDLPLTSYTSRNSWWGVCVLPETVHFCFLAGCLSLLMQVAITRLEYLVSNSLAQWRWQDEECVDLT